MQASTMPVCITRARIAYVHVCTYMYMFVWSIAKLLSCNDCYRALFTIRKASADIEVKRSNPQKIEIWCSIWLYAGAPPGCTLAPPYESRHVRQYGLPE